MSSMVKPVMITADSTCDLPLDLIKKHRIELAPLSVLLDDKSYLDGVEITPDDIYAFYHRTGRLPKTAAVPPSQYIDLFSKYQEKGYAVVHISLSSSISSSYQNACLAAGEFDDVYVVDSENLCCGMGLLVLKASDLREQGKAAKEIAAQAELLKGKVRSSFILDKLEFLHKGGRCSGITALGANLLSLKPCIEVHHGKMDVAKKYRGKLAGAYRQYTIDRLKDTDTIDYQRVIIAHSGVDESLLDMVWKTVEKQGNFKEMILARAGCTITAHCGPNTLAVMYMEKA